MEAVVEDHLYGVGVSRPPVHITTDKVSCLVNFSLADKMIKLSLNTKPIYSGKPAIVIDCGQEKFSHLYKDHCDEDSIIS